MKKITILMLFAALAACSDDSTSSNNGTNNGTTSTNNGTTTGTNNGTTTGTNNGTTTGTNNGTTGTNNGTIAPVGDIQEVEPNNDDESATPFEIGESLSGNIAAGSGDTADTDAFTTILAAGTILEIEFTHVDPSFQPVVGVYDEDGYVERYLEGDGMRQVFIPYDGVYYIYVFDARADAQHGGDSATYVLQTRFITPDVTPYAVPSVVDADANDGKVDVYSYTPAADEAVVVESTAVRAPISSQLDTILWAYHADDGAVGYDDDIDAEAENYDSHMVFPAKTGKDYWIVVDHFTNTTDGAYRLGASLTDDDIAAPQSISLGESKYGVISAVDGPGFDTDFYVLTAAAGSTVRLDLAANSANLQPTLTVAIDSIFGLFPIATALPFNNRATIELGTSTEGPEEYYLFVDDIRNVPIDGSDAENVGNELATYSLNVSTTTWTPSVQTLPLSTTANVPHGSFRWYSVTQPPASIISVKTTADSSRQPTLASLIDNVDDTIAPSTTFFNIDAGSVAKDIVFGVRDEFYRPVTATVDAKLYTLSGLMLMTRPEVEPNDTILTAETVVPSAGITGTTNGVDETDEKPDFFAVALTAGQTLIVYTKAGINAATDDADTVVRIQDAAGVQLAESDDYPGQETSSFSGIVYEATADATVFIEVVAYCDDVDCANGDYTANILVQ